MLKVVKEPGDEWRSGEVACVRRSKGMVQGARYDDGAALFERIVPGTSLVELVLEGRTPPRPRSSLMSSRRCRLTPHHPGARR
jgi:hypothetical protein